MSASPTLAPRRPRPAALRLASGVQADPPVVLAPMAGITNTAFRRICREAMATRLPHSAPGGLFVSEMITSRALVEGNSRTLRMIRFAADERPRSLQLYGVDPAVVAAAVRRVVADDLADHVDLNFGCPVPKVTRKGGGAALPWHGALFSAIIAAAVRAADGAIPVSVKMRLGIDASHLSYREAGLRAESAGVAYVAVHGRTAAQFYGGQAQWAPIAELVDLLSVPVLGNGDIWEGDDALRMIADTGCAGVVVGRGCLGRPWLFADLAAAFAGDPWRARPTLGTVAAAMRRHAALLAEWLGEPRGVTDFRKHVAWYLKGYRVGGQVRRALAGASSLAELDDLLAQLDPDQPFPVELLGQPRGRTSGDRSVALPQGWLADRDSLLVPHAAELDHGGG